ncbi:MAG: hypothetical protein U0X91_20615 [Spirosomataceae bacterium]
MKTKIGYGLILIGLLGLITLGCGFAQSPSPPKKAPILKEHFSYFVHAVAVDSMLKNWEVLHTGEMSKTITLVGQSLTVKDDGDSQITYQIADLKKMKNGYLWVVMERQKRTEIWSYSFKGNMIKRGFKTNLGTYHQIRYYPKEKVIPLHSKLT